MPLSTFLRAVLRSDSEARPLRLRKAWWPLWVSRVSTGDGKAQVLDLVLGFRIGEVLNGIGLCHRRRKEEAVMEQSGMGWDLDGKKSSVLRCGHEFGFGSWKQELVPLGRKAML